jgi:hypothetical protein
VGYVYGTTHERDRENDDDCVCHKIRDGKGEEQFQRIDTVGNKTDGRSPPCSEVPFAGEHEGEAVSHSPERNDAKEDNVEQVVQVAHALVSDENASVKAENTKLDETKSRN